MFQEVHRFFNHCKDPLFVGKIGDGLGNGRMAVVSSPRNYFMPALLNGNLSSGAGLCAEFAVDAPFPIKGRPISVQGDGVLIADIDAFFALGTFYISGFGDMLTYDSQILK